MRRLLIACLFAAPALSTLSAQRLGPPAKRPRVDTQADTNDAKMYYDIGVAKFDRDPEASAAAFYWAARINPGWGEPLYARRAALLMSNSRLLIKVMQGNRSVMQSDEVRRLDSLQFRALMLSPFLYRQLDHPLFIQYIRSLNSGSGRGDATPELDYLIDRYLAESGDGTRAWIAYSDGDFARALSLYDKAIGSARDKAPIRLDRARIFSMRSQVDSATKEFNLALEEMRKQDKKDLVIFYNSKALVEYSIAILLEGNGDMSGAREAYGRALQEDLSYYPAHMRLGLLALGLKDTTTAMSELALATEVAPDEPHVRYMHGFVLAASGHHTEAVTQLQKAIALEPFYALPYLRLAQTYERLAKGKEAADAYEGFLGRASAADPQRPYATEHLTEIKEILAMTPKP